MCWSMPHVWRVGKEYLHLRGCRWWYEEDAKKVGLFLHLRSCRPERTMEKRAYYTRRIISGVELASFHALPLFRLASLSLSLSPSSLLRHFDPPLSFTFSHSPFSSIYVYILSRVRVIKYTGIESITNDDWNIRYIRFCGCLFSWYFGRINFVIPFAGLAVKGVQ